MKIDNKGLTLLELIIGMAVFLLILGAMTKTFSASNMLYQNTIQQAKVVPIANIALEVIAEELKMSDVTNVAKTKIEYTHYRYTPNGSTVTCENESRSIYYDSQNKTIIFTQNNIPYHMIIINNVTDLTFDNHDTATKFLTVIIAINADEKNSDLIQVKSTIRTGGL